MDAAIQLHRDVCLMTTNLDVLDQYALSLQGTASKILELGLDPRGFPSAEVAAGALGPWVCRASVQMEVIYPVMTPGKTCVSVPMFCTFGVWTRLAGFWCVVLYGMLYILVVRFFAGWPPCMGYFHMF